jgi:TRAP-type uncharacterized transport system fused permease subunit
MFKKILSLVLSFLLLHAVSFVPVSAAGSANEAEAARVEKVKAGVSALGTGTNAKVKLKLSDNRKLKGYISRADEDSFVVVEKSGVETTVFYADVKQIKGNNLSSGTKVLIGVAIAAAVIGVIVAILANRGDDNNNSPCRLTGITTPCPPGCVCTQ